LTHRNFKPRYGRGFQGLQNGRGTIVIAHKEAILGHSTPEFHGSAAALDSNALKCGENNDVTAVRVWVWVWGK